MTIIGQRNYPNNKLGWGTGSIADYGCTLCCLAMMAEIDVLELNTMLKGTSFEDSAFAGSSRNLINWTKLEKYTKGLISFVWRGYGYQEDKIKTAIRNNGACLIEVDFNGTARGDDKHWILAKGNKKANDPWTGNEIPTNKYPKWTGWSEIRINMTETMLIETKDYHRLMKASENGDFLVKQLGGDQNIAEYEKADLEKLVTDAENKIVDECAKVDESKAPVIDGWENNGLQVKIEDKTWIYSKK